MKIVFATASQLGQMIREREVSAVEVLNAYLEQIAKHNEKIKAIATLNLEPAQQRAVAADAALARGENWGALHGVPITIKDCIETKNLLTTAGYPPLKNYLPAEDATVVARLKAAGAIVFAKTNPAQLAADFQTDNPIFGRTNNPWDLNCTVGGSSGGSASAIAAGFSALDLGSDVAGSVRHPAHCCGVYGLIPTDRRVTTTGHIPELPGKPKYIRHMLRIGAFARSVADLELCFSLIAGTDLRQPEVPPFAFNPPPTKRSRIPQLRIAWTYGYNFLPVSQDTRRCIQALVNCLTDAGYDLEQCSPTDLDWEEALANYSALAAYELFAASGRLGILPGIWMGIMTEFYARTQTSFRSGTPLAKKGNLVVPPSLNKYNTVLTNRDRQISQMDCFMREWDVWICPVSMTPAFPHCNFASSIEVDGTKYPYLLACGGYTMPLSLLGNPVVVVPIGQSKSGLPIGVQIVGKRWQDLELLKAAQIIAETTAGFSQPPSNQ